MWFELLLGHLTGDYLLQTEWMAMNKSKNTWVGWLAAILHCLIYTWVVCLFMWKFSLIWFVVVFCSHFFIDKFGLAEKYMKYVKGSGLKDYINMVDHQYSNKVSFDTTEGQKMLTGGFRAFVYAVTDNTMHILLMWGAYKLLY